MAQSAEAVSARQEVDEFLGHPKGLYVLFLTELWERFSYYGMRALLIFYATQHFLFDDATGSKIYGTYTSLAYLMPLIGGFLADRYLGSKRAVTFGAILLVIGHLGMAVEGSQADQYVEFQGERYAVLTEGRGEDMQQILQAGEDRYLIGAAPEGMALTGPAAGLLPEILPTGEYQIVSERNGFFVNAFFLSLAFIAMGVGFLKANISTTVGMLYAPGDRRRDSGFTIFYMGINIGSVLATLLCGWLGQTYGWKYGFGLAGIGMLLGLVVFLAGQKYLQGTGEPPKPDVLKQRLAGPLNREWLIYVGAILGIGVLWLLFHFRDLVGWALLIGGIGAVAGVVVFAVTRLEPKDRDRLLVALVLTAFGTIFWSLFEQAGSSLNLFAQRNTDLPVIWLPLIGEFQMQASQTQFFNPGFIVILAIPFSILWTRLARNKREPSTPVKFVLGLVQVGLGFLLLVFGAQFAGPDSQMALFWLAGAYLLHTTGELCLSPVGLSMITKLTVAQVVGLMMGVWFLSIAAANYVAGAVAALTASETVGGQVVDPAASLDAYIAVFQFVGVFAIAAGGVLLLLSPILKRRMHGVH
ncbi:MAG: peptide MFS transporter [Rhodothalassiaceae bacterium]